MGAHVLPQDPEDERWAVFVMLDNEGDAVAVKSVTRGMAALRTVTAMPTFMARSLNGSTGIASDKGDVPLTTRAARAEFHEVPRDRSRSGSL